jgi:hypothetical protein
VFDGPKWLRNGGRSSPGRDPPSELLRDALANIGVPWHNAPASAEAECAKMEMKGIVDAVWSEDGDALAFGCRTLIKSYHRIQSSTAEGEKKNKSTTKFRVYELDNLVEKHPGMDREGFILHAISNRSSTNPSEGSYLKPEDVLEAAQRGLAKSLCAVRRPRELQRWTTSELAPFLKETSVSEIRQEFPRWQHVQEYLKPIVSSSEVLSNLPKSREPFEDEEKLYSFLVDKLQFTLNQWVTYVLPYRIVQSLLATKEGAESQHDHLKLKCDVLKKKKGSLFPKSAAAEFLLCEGTSVNISTLFMETGEVETMIWILRKANFNQQPPIESFWSPHSNQKGKAVPSSVPRSRQRLIPGGMGLPTPLSAPAANSNGEGPSGTNRGEPSRSERQNAPPSPTPAPKLTSRKRKRNPPSQAAKQFKVSKATRAPAAKDSGYGKQKEVQTPPPSSTMRAQSPENSTPVDQRPDRNLPASLTPDAAAVDVIMINSD